MGGGRNRSNYLISFIGTKAEEETSYATIHNISKPAKNSGGV